MRLPILPIESGERIPLESGGIVDEAARRAERLGASLDKRRKSVQSCEIGRERCRFPAFTCDLRHQVQSIRRGGAIVDADTPAAIREIESDDSAEPASRAAHE